MPRDVFSLEIGYCDRGCLQFSSVMSCESWIIPWNRQYFHTAFLGAFAMQLRQVTIRFVTFVRPFIFPLWTTHLPRDGFLLKLLLGTLLKICLYVPVSTKIGERDRHFTWRRTYTWLLWCWCYQCFCYRPHIFRYEQVAFFDQGFSRN
jgi:hypothetical protein